MAIAAPRRMLIHPRPPSPAPRWRATRSTFAIVIAGLAAALLTTHCDAYTCTPEACGDGTSWGRCIACYGDSCTYEARNAKGDSVHSCDYDTSDKSARDACFAATNVAGDATCSGTEPTSSGGKCATNVGCDACTNAGCAYCATTGECQDYGSGAKCATPTIDLSSDCTPAIAGGCAKNVGCGACTDAGCAYCATTGECQDYGSGAKCATPTIDLSSDCKN